MSDSPRLASHSEDSSGPPAPSIEPAYDTVDTYRHPHPGLPPLRAYVVTCIDSILARHEGRGLVLDTVLEFETRGAADRDPGEGFFDEVVWEGDRVVAVLRYAGAASETIRLAPAPADGG
jgi:hypothetical protein